MVYKRSVVYPVVLLSLFILLTIPAVHAEQTIPLLAVEENGGELGKGSTASLTLRIIPGSGNVYLDTFPLTKLDTQMSLRFARDVACDYTEKDCDDLDFLYTLRAESPIVGGPSAGAASTLLTIAELEGITLKKNVTITGTINSGGFIGNVGGIAQKIDAAAQIGITTVLIPKNSESIDKSEDVETAINQSENQSIALTTFPEYGAQKGVTVVELATIGDALKYVSESTLVEQNEKEIQISENYKGTMRDVATQMCARTEQLIAEVQDTSEDIRNTTQRSLTLIQEGKYYSASSFCFNANIQLRKKLYENLSDSDFATVVESLDALTLEDIPSASPNNIQIYLIVHDRFEDLHDLINESKKMKSENRTPEANALLASAHERAYSISVWLKFFDSSPANGEIFDLKASCAERSAEANERIQYAKLYFPVFVQDAEQRLELARTQQGEEKYANCISNAVQAKVIGNVLLTSMGITKEQIPTIVSEKLRVAAQEIAEQDYFPVLAYSYYEYAQSLTEQDPGSALLYSEYALELANIDEYLSREKKKDTNGVFFEGIFNSSILNKYQQEIRFIGIGLLLGLLLGSVLSLYALEKQRGKKKQ